LDAHLQDVVGHSNTKAALYRDATTYKKVLPVRRDGNRIAVLYQHPFWVHEEDLQAYLDAIKAPTKSLKRGQIKYVCSGTASGKSSSVLPAFLQGVNNQDGGFTHYLPLAFHNNNSKYFWVDGKLDEETAFRAGMAFMFDCVTSLLDNTLEAGVGVHSACWVPARMSASARSFSASSRASSAATASR
jgi:hypothetical protein